MNSMQTECFKCDCFTPEHTVHFTYDPEDGDLYMSVYLWKWPWWKRIWIAAKYVFGYTSRYGDFDSGTLFRKEDLSKLSNLALKAKKRKKELEK